MRRGSLLVATALVALCAGGAGAAGGSAASLEECLTAGDPAAAAACLDGQLPTAATTAATPFPTCRSSRCPTWTSEYDDPDAAGRSDQFPSDLATSPDGSTAVIAAKDVDFDPAHPYDMKSAWALVAYDTATGAERWRSTWRSGGPYDAPGALAFSPDGTRIYATGESYLFGNPLTTPSDAAMTTIAYDAATGRVLWRASYQGPSGLDNGRAIAVSPDGRKVYVTGVSDAGHGDLDFVTAGYDVKSGKQVWAFRYTGIVAGGVDSPFGLALDPAGKYLYVTGWSAGAAEFDIDYATVAYSLGAKTKRAWVARYDGAGAHLPDEAFAVAAQGGRVYVTGLSVGLTGTGSRTYDYGTVAYDGARGTELWRARWHGAGTGFSSATAIAAAAGRVFVTGQSSAPGASSSNRDNDFGTVAYDGATGNELWSRQDGSTGYDGEFALAITSDPGGGLVYATGVSASSTLQGLADQLTIAYDPATGGPAWEARLNDGGLDHDVGTAIRVTPSAVITSGQFTHGGLDTTADGTMNRYDVGTAAYTR